MISDKKYNRLLDDIKVIAKSVKIMAQENDKVKRQFILGLVTDLVDRLYNDINNLRELKKEGDKNV